eukprot:COSAG04_NODE_518_length_13185_cov_3.605609_9_plen_109_part_00
MGFNGNVSVHDMAETYMVPLQIMLEANVSSAMCAYDAINGTPSCANGWMSNAVLRKEWGFSGVIESDCGALSHIQVPRRDPKHTERKKRGKTGEKWARYGLRSVNQGS